MVQIVKHDLEFILRQIKIAEAHSAGTPLDQIRIDANGNVVTDGSGTLAVPTTLSPYGLRTVDGSYNNLVAGRDQWGAADTEFMHITEYWKRNEGDDAITTPFPLVNNNYAGPGSVVDADPRIISNLIVDQSLDNPAAVYAALTYAGVTGAAVTTAMTDIRAAKAALDAAKADTGPTPQQIAALQQALDQAEAAADAAAATAAAKQQQADADAAAYQTASDNVTLAETTLSEAKAARAGLESDEVSDDLKQLNSKRQTPPLTQPHSISQQSSRRLRRR
jgi:hypothetical protein